MLPPRSEGCLNSELTGVLLREGLDARPDQVREGCALQESSGFQNAESSVVHPHVQLLLSHIFRLMGLLGSVRRVC